MYRRYRRNSDEELRGLEREIHGGDRAALARVITMKKRAGMPVSDDDLNMMLRLFGMEYAFELDSLCGFAFEEKWFKDQIEGLYEEPINWWSTDGDPARIGGSSVSGPKKVRSWDQSKGKTDHYRITLSASFIEDDEDDMEQKSYELEEHLSTFETELASKYKVMLLSQNWDYEISSDDVDDEVEGNVTASYSLLPHHVLAVLEKMGHDISNIEIDPDREW